MPGSDSGEKTEKGTSKRRSDERKEGHVLQSREVVTVASLLVSFYAFQLLSPYFLGSLERAMMRFLTLGETLTDISVNDVRVLFIEGLIDYVVAVIPLMLICALVPVIATFAQTKLLVTFKKIRPKFSHLNPLQGIKKMFSLHGLIELVKSLIKIVVLGYILVDVLRDVVPMLPKLMDMPVGQVMAFVGDAILDMVRTAAIIFVFVALFDYLYQWWEYEKSLRMTKQEVKEEFKQMEGDPQIKGRIRSKQQQMARQRMMQQVPSADVVIRNPTHYAVAIRYRPEIDRAPVVVAKGMDYLARRIVQIAEENDIVITENVPLARGLYDAVDLEQEIPTRFYQPVAEVLAFVYNLKKKNVGQKAN